MTGSGYFDYLPAPQDRRSQLALALFREADSIDYAPYRLLSYFKILNLLGGKHPQIAWINAELESITETRAKTRIAELQGDIGDYLYIQCRCAVAHASIPEQGATVVDPDDPEDLVRMAQDIPLVRALAAHYIRKECGIITEWEYHQAHLYELEGVRALLSAPVVERIKRGERVEAESLTPLPRIVSLRVRNHPPFPVFENLEVIYAQIGEGVVVATLGRCAPICVPVAFDFVNERFLVDPFKVELIDNGTAKAAEAIVQLLEWKWRLFCNGQSEIWSEDRPLSRSQPYMLTNMRLDLEVHEAEVEKWRAEASARHNAT